MSNYDDIIAEEYRAQLEQMGVSEEDIKAAIAELESRR
jgi:hypothetical protein